MVSRNRAARSEELSMPSAAELLIQLLCRFALRQRSSAHGRSAESGLWKVDRARRVQTSDAGIDRSFERGPP